MVTVTNQEEWHRWYVLRSLQETEVTKLRCSKKALYAGLSHTSELLHLLFPLPDILPNHSLPPTNTYTSRLLFSKPFQSRHLMPRT